MSATLIYFHGFISSPQSHKAVITGEYLQEHHPSIHYRVPALGDTPDVAAQTAEAVVKECLERADGPVALIGSSMGGFLATVLAQRYGLRAVAINPVVHPQRLVTRLIGDHSNPYTGSEFSIGQAHVLALHDLAITELRSPDDCWALLQEGDETLDYRDALAFYRGARVTCEPGGDHSFHGFERYLPEVVEFLGLLG